MSFLIPTGTITMSMAALSSSWTMPWAMQLWGDSHKSQQWFEITLNMACFSMVWRVLQVEWKSQTKPKQFLEIRMIQDTSVSTSFHESWKGQLTSLLLQLVCRIANRELMKSTHQKLEEMNAMRTEPPHKNAKAYTRWANKVWKEAGDAPTVLVPYKGIVWLARLSHNQPDFFFAEGDLFDLSFVDIWHLQCKRFTLDICLTSSRWSANVRILIQFFSVTMTLNSSIQISS